MSSEEAIFKMLIMGIVLDPSDMLTIIASISGFLLTAELVARFSKIPKIVIRKIVHVTLSLMLIAFSLTYGYKIMIFVGLFFALAFFFLRLLPSLQSVRKDKDPSIGEIAYPLGVLGSAFFAQDVNVFIISMLVLGFADTLAYLVGKVLERWSPVIIAGRTLFGSLACFLAVMTIMLLFGYDLILSAKVATAVSVVEVFSRQGWDNLTTPIITVIMINFLN